jgi:hypothetical protein
VSILPSRQIGNCQKRDGFRRDNERSFKGDRASRRKKKLALEEKKRLFDSLPRRANENVPD